MDKARPLEIAGRFDQNNFSVVYGDKVFLKIFRRLDEGMNPELEMGRFSPKRVSKLPAAGRRAGICHGRREGLYAGGCHRFIHEAKTAWEYTLDALSRYYDRAVTQVAQGHAAPSIPLDPVKMLQQEIPSVSRWKLERISNRRASSACGWPNCISRWHPNPTTRNSRPKRSPGLPARPASIHAQRGRSQSPAAAQATQNPAAGLLPLAHQVADLEGAIIQRYRELFGHRLSAKRIRIHGDCRLGELVWTGKDFFFCDFEGDFLAPFSERRIKRSPLRDATSMLRSFHYAAYAGLHQHMARGSFRERTCPASSPG